MYNVEHRKYLIYDTYCKCIGVSSSSMFFLWLSHFVVFFSDLVWRKFFPWFFICIIQFSFLKLKTKVTPVMLQWEKKCYLGKCGTTEFYWFFSGGLITYGHIVFRQFFLVFIVIFFSSQAKMICQLVYENNS